MRKKGRIARALATVLLFASLIGTAGASHVAAEDTMPEYDESKYDFSHKSAENETLGALDVVLSYLDALGQSVSDAERKFLSEHNLLSVTYSDSITTEYVDLSYDPDSGSVSVEAKPYSYRSGAGEIKWVPVSAKLGENTVPLTDGAAIFTDGARVGDKLTVFFEASVVLDRDDIGALINLYHDTAKYVAEYDGYDDHLAAYEEYLIALRIYNDAYAEYLEYLSDYGGYLAEYEKYLEYEERMRRYWEDYGKYEEYLAELEDYGKNTEEYLLYLEKLSLISRQLKAFELVKVPMTDKRTVYSAVMGDLVDKVLENETALVEACGVDDPRIIWQAGDSTERLRTLMKGYYDQPDERSKYNYYLINYNNIKDSVQELLNSLNKLYSYRKVRAMLIADEKDKKYIILVSQLALIANALTDGPLTDYDGKAAYGPTWKIEGNTVAAILENKTYYEDRDDASPLTDGYPSERKEPMPPSEVKKPEMPQEQNKPTPPTEVSDPGDAPREVQEPQTPSVPSHIAGVLIPTLSEKERAALRGEFESGAITERDAPSTDFSLTLHTCAERTVGSEEVEIVFKSITGATLEIHKVEKGGFVIFEGDEPYRPEDEYNSYRFAGWQTASGELISLDSLTAPCEVYPYFEKAPKYYNVTWVVDGKTVTQRLVSDIIPECPIPTDKVGDLEYYYVFDGWDKELEPVGRDITYVATYKRMHVISYTGGGAAVTDDGERVTVDARSWVSTDTEHIDISPMLERISGKRSLTLRTVRGDLHFSFAETIALSSLFVDSVGFETRQMGNGANTFSVALYSDGERISEPISFDAVLYHSVTDNGDLRLIKNERVSDSVKFRLDGQTVTFRMENGAVYKLRPVYDVSVVSDTGVMIAPSNVYPEPGQIVKINVQYVYGYRPRTLEVINKSTGENILGDDMTFRMPSSDVTVRGTSEIKTYTVLFKSDGAVISSETYRHGEKVIPPASPQKEADGEYVYTFGGWTPDLTSYISEDAVYSAIWRTEPVPEKVDDGEIKLSEGVRRLATMAFSALCIFAVGVIPCTVLSIVLGVKHRRRARLLKIHKNGV